MKNNMKYTSLLFSLLCVCSCTNEDIIENNPTTKEEMTFSLVMDEASVMTRAYSDYHTGATELNTKSVVIGISNKAEADDSSVTDKKLKVRKRYPTDGSAANIVYWDDVSSDTYDVRKEGVTVNIWGARLTKGVTTESDGSVTISDVGKITWTIDTDQKTNGIDINDLLAADYQSEYKASTAAIPLCFHHAMTKITVNVKGGEGFTAAEVTNDPSVVLSAMNTEAEVDLTKKHGADNTDAETGFINPSVDAESKTIVGNVDMHQLSSAPTGFDVRFDAIVVPGNTIKVGDIIGIITLKNANNTSNSYNLVATKKLIGGWTNTEEASVADDASVTFAYGTHYIINATVNKQEIILTAQVVDWNTKEGAMDGKVLFSADVKNTDQTNAVTNGSFDLWKATNDADASYGTKASTYTYDATNGWKGAPVLYWPNGVDSYYFRALATYSKDTENKDVLTAVAGQKDAAQGTDLLWAQTSEHTGTTDGGSVNYAAGAPINPRTGNVPLTFQHAMSKISVTLKNKYTSSNVPTGVDASNYNDPRNPLVNLEGAKISIINLYDKGTIDISTGKMVKTSLDNSSTTVPYTIKDKAVVKKTVDSKDVYQWQDYIVVPQSLIKDNSNAGRETAPSFYSLANLTPIYSNKKSVPVAGETPTYYLTTELEKVEVKYTEEEANAYNLALPAPAAVWTTSTIKEPERLYTYEEFKTVFPTTEYQTLLASSFATIPTKAKQIDYTFAEFKDLTFSAELFAAIPNDLKIKTPAGTYADVQEYNTAKGLDNSSADKTSLTEEQFAALSDEQKAKPAVLFQFEEIDAFRTALASKETVFISLSGDWKKKTLTLDVYKALNPVPEELFNLLPESLKTRPAVTYTVEEVNAHNATLPGAVHEGDIKTIYHKIKENTTPESHKIGELINRGNKIMLYVTLADGTIYSIDLATCKVDGSDVGITEWEGGIHYNYTITLSKEEITFRALVKDWVPAEGSGNATLDWD